MRSLGCKGGGVKGESKRRGGERDGGVGRSKNRRG